MRHRAQPADETGSKRKEVVSRVHLRACMNTEEPSGVAAWPRCLAASPRGLAVPMLLLAAAIAIRRTPWPAHGPDSVLLYAEDEAGLKLGHAAVEVSGIRCGAKLSLKVSPSPKPKPNPNPKQELLVVLADIEPYEYTVLGLATILAMGLMWAAVKYDDHRAYVEFFPRWLVHSKSLISTW